MTDPGLEARQRSVGAARTLGGVGALASCLPMVAMLPGGFAAALGLIGLGSSSAAVRTLAPQLNSVAQPLLLVSVTLLAVTSLRCSRLAVASAASGGVLLYLGMYLITRSDGSATPLLFYPGLALFLATYPVSFVRRRQAACRPLVSARNGRRLLATTLALGVGIVAASAISGFGAPAANAMTGPRAPAPTGRHTMNQPAGQGHHANPTATSTPGSMNSMQP